MDGCRKDYYSPCEQCGKCNDRKAEPINENLRSMNCTGCACDKCTGACTNCVRCIRAEYAEEDWCDYYNEECVDND